MNRQEFEEALASPHCIDFWMGKSKDEVTELLGTDVGNMVGFDQRNLHHCFDLFTHSLHTVESVKTRTPGMSTTERCILLCAAFFHDIGKVACATEKSGRLVFYGHSIKSAEIAQSILKHLGYSPTECETICFLIAHHDDFISFVTLQEFQRVKNKHYKAINEHTIMQHIYHTEATLEDPSDWYDRDLWKKLCILCLADADSQSVSVELDGKEITSRKRKLAKIAMIQSFVTHLY